MLTIARSKRAIIPKEQALAQLQMLSHAIEALPQPMGEVLAQQFSRDPFILLIACLLSLRARDTAVHPVSLKLFQRAPNAGALAQMPLQELEAILRPIGFYRAKAATIQRVARIIVEDYQGMVPNNPELLGSLPGVGPKTVQFMMCYAFEKPAICVDTHVHRLSNAFRWVATQNVAETEIALKKLFPVHMWGLINTTLVAWGQNVCGSLGVMRKNRMLHDTVCPCHTEVSATEAEGHLSAK